MLIFDVKLFQVSENYDTKGKFNWLFSRVSGNM